MSLLYLILAIFTATIGYNIHHSIGWTLVDFFFWPLVWVKWFAMHEVNLTLIKQSFSWFFH